MLGRIYFVILMMLGSSAYSQVSFYISPNVSMKTNTSFFPSNHGYRDKRMSISNDYFSFVHYGRFFDRNQINIGLNVGVKWNNRHFLELGLSTDQASIANTVSIHELMVDSITSVRTSYPNGGGGTNSTGALQRFSLSYQMMLWKNKNNTVNLRGVAGIGFMHSRKSGFKDDWYIDTMYYHSSEDNNGNIPPKKISIDNIYEVSYQRMGFSLNANIGFGIDFISKEKQRNICSFDIFYLHNAKIMLSSTHRFRVSDNMLTTDYIYHLSSSGSGFYFNISKKIQIYPWRTFKQKKETLPYD